MAMSPRLLRPRASGFNPRSISGLALWLDASDASSLYTTDAGAVTAVSSPLDIAGCALWLDADDPSSITADGSNLVSQWNDKSGNARHATSSGSNRPTRTSAAQNGRAVLTFDGTSSQMAIDSTFLVTSNATILAVARRTSGTYGAVITSKGAGDSSPALQHASGSWQIAYSANISVIGSQASYAILCGTISSGATAAYANGLTQDSDASSGPLSSDATKTYIGTYRAAIANVLAGEIAEIIVFNTALSATDRVRVEAYLAAKWGISGVHAPATVANDPVGAWLDKSGNGRHATQATGALRPTLGTLGAKNALAFAGNAIATQSYAAKATSTYVYVGRHDDTADTFFQTGPTNGFHSHLVESTSKFRRNDTGTKGVVLASNVGVGAVSLWCVDFSNDAISVRHNGVTYGTTSVASEAAISDSSRATTLGRLAAAETYAQLNGRIAEFMVYGGRNLTSDERSRLERHLASKYAITLAPAASNADAQDWINRVYQNGGTVSASTASAVNQFCSDIDSAGIRDRFYRMGIFAGTGLNAALVPLYRGPSLGGTQYGNTTDTNVGPFVSGDYVETGASGGLTSNGTSKYLNTGFKADALGQTDRHISMVGVTTGSSASKYFLGMDNFGCGSSVFWGILTGSSTFSQYMVRSQAGATNSTQFSAANGHVLVSGNGSASAYADGAFAVTGPATAYTAPNLDVYVHALNRCGSSVDYTAARMKAYSIGASMTASQVSAFYTAMNAFQTALSRA